METQNESSSLSDKVCALENPETEDQEKTSALPTNNVTERKLSPKNKLSVCEKVCRKKPAGLESVQEINLTFVRNVEKYLNTIQVFKGMQIYILKEKNQLSTPKRKFTNVSNLKKLLTAHQVFRNIQRHIEKRNLTNFVSTVEKHLKITGNL